VYPSDIKKVIQWYNILSRENLLSVIDEAQEAEGDDEQDRGADQPAEGNDQQSSDEDANTQENA
jgi:hypothetical protein